MKIYKVRKRMNNPHPERNIVGWKNPFYEATVDDKPLPSKMIDPTRDSKNRGVVFAYGYHGVYPANLAVSLLCDFFEIEDYPRLFADTGYGVATNRFYKDFICENKAPSWQITEDVLWKYMEDVADELEREGKIYEEV